MQSNNIRRSLLAALATVGAITGTAYATSVTVGDYSFEKTVLTDGSKGGISTNWSGSGNGGFFVLNSTDDYFTGTTGDISSLPSPADGTNCYVVNLTYPGYLWQNVGTVQPNTTYTLTVAVGRSLISDGGVGKLAFVNGVNPFGTILASTPVDSTAFDFGTFADSTLVFTTGQNVSGPLTILIESDTGTQLIYDNVRLDASAAPNTPTALLPTASPTNVVYQGTKVTLTEDPAGTAPFTYQWQSDKATGTFSDISGATSASYEVDTTSITSGTQYRVVVKNSLGTSTSAAITITTLTGAPTIVSDTIPTTITDVVSNTVTFSATIQGTMPITYQWQKDGFDISGATSSTLTLSNIKISDSGSYSLNAQNNLGSVSTTPATLLVNEYPSPSNGVYTVFTSQLGLGGSSRFVPTWTVDSGSLISGMSPSSVGAGNFSYDGSGTVSVLTDGKSGTLYPAGNGSTDFVTCGNNAGTSITYTLPTSETGYDLNKIVVYGGWSDAGRDEQDYIVAYSTVANPTSFNTIVAFATNPDNANAYQSATRSVLTSATGSTLAKNVAAVKFVFNDPENGVENGYAGYSEIQVFGQASAAAPVISSDIRPGTATDVVGSSITMTASFKSQTDVTYQWEVNKGSGYVNVSGATSTNLTLSNLKLTDSGTYRLKASNASGTTTSGTCVVTVAGAPTVDANGILVSLAGQTGTSDRFTPTWTIDTNSIVYKMAPSSVGSGSFATEGAGGTVKLTDGTYGAVGSGDNSTLATCGSAQGTSLTYTLPGTAGYDITKIVTYAGWGDKGRDEQAYTVSYALSTAPSVFVQLTSADYNPDIPSGVKTADRVTLTLPGNAVIAKNVVAIKFDFTTPAGENGYSGYAEIEVSGTPSVVVSVPPSVKTDIVPATAFDVVGSSLSMTASFYGDSPMSYQWQKDGTDIAGATNLVLTLTNLQLTDATTVGYTVTAKNSLGTATSAPCQVTVNPAPDPIDGMIIALSGQSSTLAQFTPTWTIDTNSVILGATPSSVGTGSFMMEGAGGTTKLTDGNYGIIGSGNGLFATCGSAQGTSLTYTLPGSDSGYDLTKIVTYAGWGDNGRDEQAYTISYAVASAPNTFIQLAMVDNNPDLAGQIKSADRVVLTAPANAVFAKNVVKIQFDFTNPAGENGYSGYTEISVLGTPSAAIQVAPSVKNDTLPTTASDVVGGEVTLKAAFYGSEPLTYQWQKNGANISGATSSTLTLKNLQTTDTGAYTLVAKNSLGSATSTPSQLTVNALSTPVNGVLVNVATQTGTNAGQFTTTWTLPTGSLLAGALPSEVGAGDATIDACGGVKVLTDGTFGLLNPPGMGSATLAALGSGSGVHYVTYTFSGPASITNIAVYGGWSDGGRDQQAYTVSYSTTADPATFTTLATVSCNPTLPAAIESATRVTLVSATGGAIAANVAALKFDFTNPAGENGYSGYSEIEVFGAINSVVVAPTLDQPTYAGGNVVLSGKGGTPGATYTWLTSTNLMAPISEWTISTTGTLDSKGDFSVGIPVTNTEATRFFRLKVQ